MAQPISTRWIPSDLNPSDEASRWHDPMHPKRRRVEPRLPIAPPPPMTGVSVGPGDRVFIDCDEG
eukprot:10373493-Heterocapsa_arctica.AAC.1